MSVDIPHSISSASESQQPISKQKEPPKISRFRFLSSSNSPDTQIQAILPHALKSVKKAAALQKLIKVD